MMPPVEEIKRSAAAQYNQMEALIDGFTIRFERRAEAILNAEARNAGNAYESGGEAAAVLAIDPEVWEDYVTRLWYVVGPDAARMTDEWLAPKAFDEQVILSLVRQKITEGARRKAMEIAEAGRAEIRYSIEMEPTPAAITARRIANRGKAQAPARSRRIAYTETHESANYGSLVQARNVRRVYNKVWNATPDDRVRDAHMAAHRQSRKVDQAFLVGGEPLEYPGDSEHGSPANIINCFPADTEVIADAVRTVYRRWYEGELIEVETSFGDKLAGTPNHPIFTARGWVPLHAIDKADTLFRRRFSNNAADSGPNVKRVPSMIGDIYDAQEIMGERILATGIDFHGDVANSQVDVVLVDRKLLDRVNAAFDEEISEHFLAFSHERQTTLSTQCEAFGALPRYGLPHGVISGGNELPPLLGRHPRQAQNISLTSVTAWDAGILQHARNDKAADAESVSNRQFGIAVDVCRNRFLIEGVERMFFPSESECFRLRECSDVVSGQPFLNGGNGNAEMLGEIRVGKTGSVELAQVVAIRRRYFRGHVFNLETDTGKYWANNILAHNCRCNLTYEARVRMED